MANHTPLATWLYSKRIELNARFREFNWPERIFPGVFDFETKISWNGIEADGRGVDSQREIALEKSVAEALERLVCRTLEFDSVGFAIAGTHDPSQHAKFERLERFYLEEHLKNVNPFSKLNFEYPEYAKLKDLSPSAKIDFYRMATEPDLYGIVCRIGSETPGKTSLGFALSDSIEQSIRRAFFEALPSYAWMISDEELELRELPWHLKPSFLEKMNALFSDSRKKELATLQSPQLALIELNLSSLPILSDAPIKMARYLIARPS